MVEPAVTGRFGVVLLPDPATSQMFVEMSAALGTVGPSSIRLGLATNLPHVTVVHVDANVTTAAVLWNQVLARLDRSYDLETYAMYMRPSGDAVNLGAVAHCTGALRAAHEMAVRVAESCGLTVRSDAGDRYWPHVTLGRWDTPPTAAPTPRQDMLQTFEAVPVLARMGAHQTVAEVLAYQPTEGA